MAYPFLPQTEQVARFDADVRLALAHRFGKHSIEQLSQFFSCIVCSVVFW